MIWQFPGNRVVGCHVGNRRKTPATTSRDENTEEVIDFASGADGGMSDTSALIGFVAGDTPGCSYGRLNAAFVAILKCPEMAGLSRGPPVENIIFAGFSAEDPIYEKAIAECYVIKESPSFCEGILLKCIDKQRMFI
ncbi:hypothetical protein ANCCEY_02257 [Ancylostoma ceylanicum]|uniref:Uncharacterized protein n=1 Tax=Ancylostoma ceylanicum TaxID=53326 RepID=A0A0D6M3C2_9BILA|nr:hypothetical protein ANCCEY_02257 [Ancylostoma ceylanicum]